MSFIIENWYLFAAVLLSSTLLFFPVLTGAGGHFCAGDDVVAFSAVPDSAEKDAWRVRIQECYAALQSAPKPVIALRNAMAPSRV